MQVCIKLGASVTTAVALAPSPEQDSIQRTCSNGSAIPKQHSAFIPEMI